VVDHDVARLGAKALLDSLLELGINDVALLNVIPDNLGSRGDGADYLPWPAYIEFLSDMFRCWWPQDRDKVNIRELQALINNLSGSAPNTCVLAGDCMGQYLTIEPDGGISACDKYIGDSEFEFGNILHSDLNTLLSKSKNLTRARSDAKLEVAKMTDCKYLPVCRVGCISRPGVKDVAVCRLFLTRYLHFSTTNPKTGVNMASKIELTTQDISNLEQRLKATSLPDAEKNLLNSLLAMANQNRTSDAGASVAWIYVWEPPK
jgi:radical SAM protein with 4Fe4S-binding SPASM domain